jgi:hypothetical protein
VNWKVDDVGVELSQGGGRAIVQAKRSLTRGAAFADVVAQWQHAVRDEDLDPTRDRLGAATSTMAPWLRHLSSALRRRRQEGPPGFPKPELAALTKFEGMLGELSAEQRDRLLGCAVLLEIRVEEEAEADAMLGTMLLDTAVVPLAQGPAAWSSLLNRAGRSARRGELLRVGSWAQALREVGCQLVADPSGVPVARAEARRLAVERDRERSIREGEWISLRGLGAAVPRLPVEAIDAGVSVGSAEDPAHGGDLAWVQRPWGRVVVVGPPGAGKSVALHRLEADWCEAETGPLPLRIALKELADEPGPLGDALIRCGLREVPEEDRELLAEEIRERLASGRLALLLDGLDEAGEKVGEVMDALEGFLAEANPDLEIVITTRDVSAAQAQTLGLTELRMLAPARPLDAVEGVLAALAPRQCTSEEERISGSSRVRSGCATA